MRTHVEHITEVKFLSAFEDAFFPSITEWKITRGFRGVGIVPLDPVIILSKLDVKLQIPTPTGFSFPTVDDWVSETI